MTILPSINKLRLTDNTRSFIKQAQKVTARQSATRLIAQQHHLKQRAQQQLQSRVSKVTNTPLLEGGLYEYRKHLLRTRKWWKLKAMERRQVQVRLHDYGPLKQQASPVVYLNNVNVKGIKSLYKFCECDFYVPALKPESAWPLTTRPNRTVQVHPGSMARWC